MPTGARIIEVVLHVVELENEVLGDAVGEVELPHVAADRGLGRKKAVLGDRHVEPVLGAVVVLEADLGLVVGEVVARADVVHVAVLLLGRLEGVGEHAAERRGDVVGVGLHVAEASEDVESSGVGDGDQTGPGDVTQVLRGGVAENDRGRHILSGDRVDRQDHEPGEPVRHIEGLHDGGLNEQVLGTHDVPVETQE